MHMRLASLLERVARLESFDSFDSFNARTAAGKPYLAGEGLTKEKVQNGEASMLYKIDPSTNQSKYYEMLIVFEPNKGGYTLIKRWGRLGPRFQENMDTYSTLQDAKKELAATELSKVKKGYISAFGPYHRNLGGKKLPLGQYPVGLEGRAGPWQNQEVVSCKPVISKIIKGLNQALTHVEAGRTPRVLLADLEELWVLSEGLTESMIEEVRKKLRAPLERLRGTNGRFSRDPEVIARELRSLHRYLDLQMSICS